MRVKGKEGKVKTWVWKKRLKWPKSRIKRPGAPRHPSLAKEKTINL